MIRIDQERCKACGICAHVCPRHIPETTERDGEKVTVVCQERIHLCMECGHCEAICPDSAIHVDGLNAEGFNPIQELDMDENQLLTLMKQLDPFAVIRTNPYPVR